MLSLGLRVPFSPVEPLIETEYFYLLSLLDIAAMKLEMKKDKALVKAVGHISSKVEVTPLQYPSQYYFRRYLTCVNQNTLRIC